MPTSQSLALSFRPRSAAHARRRVLPRLICRLLLRRLHPRRRHRCHRRQSHRRQRRSCQQRQSHRLGGLHGRRQLPDPHRLQRPLFSRRLRQKLPPVADARFLRRPVRFHRAQLVLEPAWVRESIVVTATGTPTPQAANQRRHHRARPARPCAARRPRRALCASCPEPSLCRTASSVRKLRSSSAAATPTTTKSSSTASTPAIWATNSISARSPPRPSRAPRSIAGPIRASTAPAPDRASSASPRRTAPPASLPCSFRATPAIFPLRASSSRWPARTRNSTTSAPSVGCKPPTICPTTSTMSPRRQPISAGRSTARRSSAPRSTTASTPPAFPMRGTSITSPTTPRKRIRTSSSSAVHRQPDHRKPAQHRPLRAHAQTRAGLPSGPCPESPQSYHRLLLRPRNPWQHRHHHRRQRLLRHRPGRARLLNVSEPSTSPTAIRLGYQGDITITPHLSALAGFQYEDERGAEPGSTYYTPVERTNYFIPLAVHGDFKNRFFYTLGRQPGALLPLRPPNLATRRPQLLRSSPTQRRLQRHAHSLQLRRGRSASPSSPIRTIRSTLSSRHQRQPVDHSSSCTSVRLPRPRRAPTRAASSSPSSASTSSSRTSYFHNEFGKEIEYVGLDLIPELLPNLTPAQQQALEERPAGELRL